MQSGYYHIHLICLFCVVNPNFRRRRRWQARYVSSTSESRQRVRNRSTFHGSTAAEDETRQRHASDEKSRRHNSDSTGLSWFHILPYFLTIIDKLLQYNEYVLIESFKIGLDKHCFSWHKILQFFHPSCVLTENWVGAWPICEMKIHQGYLSCLYTYDDYDEKNCCYQLLPFLLQPPHY